MHPSLLKTTAILLILWLAACSSGKVAFEHGNYYEAVLTATERLRRNADHSKSIETLRQAYPLALQNFEDRANNALSSGAAFKWRTVVESYSAINVMYDEIRRSPGALKVIPNPANYYAKLEEAKENAAEESYAAGIAAMVINTREKAKEAYYLFKTVDGYMPGYKDVAELIPQAKWNATVKVLVYPIPVQSRNVEVSAEFFDNKISEYLHQNSINEFVRFFTLREAETLKLRPDHTVKLAFDDFVIGQAYLNEKQYALTRDSVVVGYYYTKADGSRQDIPTGGGNTGNGGNSGNAGNSGNSGNAGNSGNSGNAGNSGNTGNAGNSGNTGNGGNTGNSGNSGNAGNAGNSGNAGGNSGQGNNDKIVICHLPPGDTSNRQTLEIPRAALDAHLAHGDRLGACDDQKGKGDDKKADDKSGKGDGQKKPTDKKGDSKKDGKTGSLLRHSPDTPMIASASDDYWKYFEVTTTVDTVKVYGTVKATYYHYKKTITSKAVINFTIIDSKTGGIISVEKMPGESVWFCEWARFNGDDRALTPEQLHLTLNKELMPPPPQDLFIEFTRPIYDQLTRKLAEFYKKY